MLLLFYFIHYADVVRLCVLIDSQIRNMRGRGRSDGKKTKDGRKAS